ncbi:MAG: PA14 domain-containing protein, partial [Candidatus Latescibacterota bacterium]|nr:PA14 domain-containing protein [Candidatus Latescibacterota bacterium]
GENTNPLPSDINWLNIGGDAAGNNSLRGVIDDFAVFASALDEDQILALSEGDRSILPSAPTHPIFVSASPDTAAADGSAELSVTLYKRGDDAANAQLSVNGTDVATTVATDGTTITITGTATGLASGTATAQVSYNGVSNAWAISVPNRAIDHGDGTVTFDAHVAWEWWDGIGGAHPMENLTDNARYPDSPDGATFAPSWNTRTALAGGFEGNGRDSYGGRMSGILTAPETGTYRFFIASDDHGLLRISTDADPANAVRVAEETGCCKNFTLDDGGLSGTVDLVAGNQYYMEALLKEGGGGDWMTVGWRMPSEGIDNVPGGNQEGIPGEYFTSTVRVPALSALSSSLGISAGTSMDPKATITLNVTNGATTLDAGSVVISLGGTALDSTATEGTWSKDFAGASLSGATYSISADTGAIAAGTEHAVSATFKDSAGETTTLDATFTI